MKIAYRLLLTVTMLVTALAIGFGALQQYRRSYPELAFAQITGRTLPAGVRATAYGWEINDNFLHVSHYWLLTGSSVQLRQFASDTSLSESTEDARYALPDMPRLFGRPQLVVAIGYEGDQPRNNWYWLFTGESEALYEYN